MLPPHLISRVSVSRVRVLLNQQAQGLTSRWCSFHPYTQQRARYKGAGAELVSCGSLP